MVEGITIKHTKNNKTMVFLTIEDLLGTVEVVVFPRQYEIYRNSITQDGKLFIRDTYLQKKIRHSKLICERSCEFARHFQKNCGSSLRTGRVFMAEEKDAL